MKHNNYKKKSGNGSRSGGRWNHVQNQGNNWHSNRYAGSGCGYDQRINNMGPSGQSSGENWRTPQDNSPKSWSTFGTPTSATEGWGLNQGNRKNWSSLPSLTLQSSRANWTDQASENQWSPTSFSSLPANIISATAPRTGSTAQQQSTIGMAGPNTAAAASGHIAKELGNWGEVLDYYKRPSELFNECGRVQPAADALAKGARALEEASPDEAIQLYTDACFLLEEDGREQMAFDLYRAGTSVYLKPERYDDAATFLPRFGLSADHCNAVNSQCKEPTKLDSNKSGDGKDDVTAVVKVFKKKTKELGAQKAVDNIRAEDYIAAPAESSKRKKSRQS